MREMNSGEKFKKWENTIQDLFNFNVPSTCTWENHLEIINVLNKLGSIPNLNHSFIPSGGGQDLTSVKVSSEEDCIELKYSGIVDIVKPKMLTFNYLGDSFEWAYFRLETGGLKPSGVYSELPEEL